MRTLESVVDGDAAFSHLLCSVTTAGGGDACTMRIILRWLVLGRMNPQFRKCGEGKLDGADNDGAQRGGSQIGNGVDVRGVKGSFSGA